MIRESFGGLLSRCQQIYKVHPKLWLTFATNNHCVKSVQMWSFFWSVFSHIRTEYGDLWSKVYLFKVNNRNTRVRCKMCSKLTKKYQDNVIDIALVSLLLDLNVLTPFSSVCNVGFEHLIVCWVHQVPVKSIFRDGSRATATSKMERFVIMFNGFQPLTIITKCSILDVTVSLDPPLIFIEIDHRSHQYITNLGCRVTHTL